MLESPLHPIELPPMGVRVVGFRRSDGHRLIVYRKRMPRRGWAWGQHYHIENLAQDAIVRWTPWEGAPRRD